MEDSNSNDRTRSFLQLASDTAIGHYRIIEKIGAGGMGEVYLALDTELNREVALKFLPPHLSQDADCRARFKREAQAAAKLDHPNIVAVYDVGEFQGRPYFAMQLIRGDSLRELSKVGGIRIERIIDLAIQVCEGLLKAHQAGIIHRDIKPANILLDADGRPRIADFGLASCLDTQAITQTGVRVGTVGYMSPEQLRDEKIDQRADLFSLGIVIYELITGHHPFAADNHEAAMVKTLSVSAPPIDRYRADVPAGLSNVVERALEKDAAVRYQSAADMLADLRRLRRRSSDSARQQLPPQKPPARAGRRFGLIGAAVVVAAAALWWLVQSDLLTGERHRHHLAIIPFTNLSGESTSQALCDGLMETIASKLTQVAASDRQILVVPVSEVRAKGVKSAAQARRVFGVHYAVTGSMQRLGKRIRTTLNLVDAETERQIRSTVLDEYEDDMTSLQDAGAIEVARLLDIELRPESGPAAKASRTASPEAYSAYLEGRGFLQRHDNAASLDSAQQCFDRAVKADSSYAPALAGLGEVFWRRFALTKNTSWVSPAVMYSSRALELDDRLAPVLVILGIIHRETGQYQEAVSYFKRALLIDSLESQTYRELASAYEALDRIEKAESTYQRSISLQPLEWGGYYDLARFYSFRGRNSEALIALRKAEALAPPARFPLESLGSLYTHLGEHDTAVRLLEQSLAIEPGYVALSNLGVIYQVRGDAPKAVAMYEGALRISDLDYRVWSNLAWLYRSQPGGVDKSQRAYTRAVALAEQMRQINPSDATLLCHLADCYWQIGERDKALSLAYDAQKLASENVDILVRAGVIFELAGRRDEALASIGKAVAKGYPVEQIRSTEELRRLAADPEFERMLAKE